jgi:two-component system nitrate/nitrite response regulator NarL
MPVDPEPADRIRILVADDHTLLREAVVDVLAREPGFLVVAQAENGEAVLRLARQTKPAVVLLDLQMSDHRPAHTIRQLLRLVPAPKVIIVSMFDHPELVARMIALGAHGYLHKAVRWQDLTKAIYSIVRGGQTVKVVPPRVAAPAAHAAQAAQAPPRPPVMVVLTEREREVLMLVARALSNRQIAVELEITEGTVKRHLRNIFGKLGAVSRIDAVNKAAVSVPALSQYADPSPGLRTQESQVGT